MNKLFQQLKENLNYERTNLILLTIPMLAMSALLFFQFSHLIISIWNIAPVAIMLFIYIGCIKRFIECKNKLKLTKTSKETTIPEQNTFSTIDKQKIKHKKKSVIIKIISLIICIMLSALFFCLHSKKTKNLTAVNASVGSQIGEVITETEYDEFNDEITTTESRYCTFYVSYNFNGNKYGGTLEISSNDKIYSKTIKIYVNQNGTIVDTFGKIEIFKWFAIIFTITSILILLFIIFKFGIEFFISMVILFIGLAVMFIGNMGCFEDFFYSEITTFSSLFIMLGLFALIALTINKVSRNNTNETEEQTDSLSTEEKIENTKKRLSKFRCKFCDAVLSKNSNKCPNCGAPSTKQETEIEK